MRTQFNNSYLSVFNVTKWSFNVLSFIVPLVLSIFINDYVWKIVLTCMIVLFPLISELIFKLIKGFYFKKKIKFILNKNFEIKAVGMYILPTYRTDPDEFNSKVQSSEEYLITIKIFFNFWKSNLKITGFTKIDNDNSSSFSSTNVDVWFESDNSIKIRYIFDYDHIATPKHKTKYIADFNGICTLHFNSQGNLIDYYYSSDGKNRFSYVKKWGLRNE